jgi:ABC-type bacteriocin/lantibiotic exporter with double-glycine peptidase domain
MIKLLSVKPFKQVPRRCGPASLKMVLEYYGIMKSEGELTKLTKCNKSGTRTENIVLAAKRFGMDAYVKDNSSIKEISILLKKGIPVIIDWFSQDEGHYSVVVGIDAKNIYLQDPELGKARKLDKKTFMRVWFDFEGEYLKSSKELIIRRIIVINKRNKNNINKK